MKIKLGKTQLDPQAVRIITDKNLTQLRTAVDYLLYSFYNKSPAVLLQHSRQIEKSGSLDRQNEWKVRRFVT